MKITDFSSVYFIGIKGVAVTGLAVICKQLGLRVSGSDVSEKFITDKILLENDIEVFESFNAENLDSKPELVVVGASWGDDNVEVAAAKKSGMSIISDSDMRGMLSEMKRTIAVTGVHGKTTTTALLSYILQKTGKEPSYLIGTGRVPDLQDNAAWQPGNYFVVEGDEYIRSQAERSPKFLDLHPAISIITSIEWEHVDIYPDVEALEKVFSQLIEKTSDKVVACGDWPSIQKIITGHEDKVVTYGFDESNMYRASDIRIELSHTVFSVSRNGEKLGECKISLHGKHNVLNTLACLVVAELEGVPFEIVKNVLPGFTGAERRFDVSERNDVIFVDDYGHHPTEIATTLEAVRHRYPDKQIWCVFQPHMASRTKALLEQFTHVFDNVDKVFIADIFASARERSDDIDSQVLANQIAKKHADVHASGDLNETLNAVRALIQPGIVLVTMGAGDVYRVRDKLIEQFDLV